VEQAVALATTVHGRKLIERDGGGEEFVLTDPGLWVEHEAGRFLTYVTEPQRQAEARLLEAARAFDGTQDAGALIGLLADALDGRMAAKDRA
jgi:hypothetical protein